MRPVNLPAFAGSALAGLLAATACGGNGGATRLATVDDLPTMVLQKEDVPAALTLLREDGETRGLVKPLYDPSAEAMFLKEFELPPEQAEPGAIVCIRNSVVLYETAEEAKRVFGEVGDLQNSFEKGLRDSETEVPWSEIDVSALAMLGDERKALRLVSPRTDFCSSYEDEPAEAYFLVSLRDNVAAGLMVWTYDEGASFDEAIELARRQARRVDAVFEGESRD